MLLFFLTSSNFCAGFSTEVQATQHSLLYICYSLRYFTVYPFGTYSVTTFPTYFFHWYSFRSIAVCFALWCFSAVRTDYAWGLSSFLLALAFAIAYGPCSSALHFLFVSYCFLSCIILHYWNGQFHILNWWKVDVWKNCRGMFGWITHQKGILKLQKP